MLALRGASKTRFWNSDLMKEELSQALTEALFELEILPKNPDGAMLGMYAVMDDLQMAIQRTQSLDLSRTAAA
jgi:hypothetical protein